MVRAQDALCAVTALARLHRNDLTLVNQMIRVAITGLAFDTTWPALQVPGWTEPQLAELQSQWQQLELFKMVPSTFEMERARTLEIFEQARTNGLNTVRGGAAPSPTPRQNLKEFFEGRVLDSFWRVAWVERDELFYLETMQRVIEALRSGSRHRSWTRLSAEVAETYDRFDARLRYDRGDAGGPAMRMRGLEPPRGCPHTDLNRARLPIPPHPRGRTV